MTSLGSRAEEARPAPPGTDLPIENVKTVNYNSLVVNIHGLALHSEPHRIIKECSLFSHRRGPPSPAALGWAIVKTSGCIFSIQHGFILLRCTNQQFAVSVCGGPMDFFCVCSVQNRTSTDPVFAEGSDPLP